MNLTIRKATVDDATTLSTLNDDVQQLHADALPDIFKQPSDAVFPAAMVTDLINEPNNLFFIAEVAGEAVGYIWAEIRRRPETDATYARDSIMIHHISVRPAYRHKGLGEQLIATVKEVARAEKIATVLLDTWSFNTDAQAFFARQGFTIYNYRLWTEVAEGESKQ